MAMLTEKQNWVSHHSSISVPAFLCCLSSKQPYLKKNEIEIQKEKKKTGWNAPSKSAFSKVRLGPKHTQCISQWAPNSSSFSDVWGRSLCALPRWLHFSMNSGKPRGGGWGDSQRYSLESLAVRKEAVVWGSIAGVESTTTTLPLKAPSNSTIGHFTKEKQTVKPTMDKRSLSYLIFSTTHPISIFRWLIFYSAHT